MSILVTGGSGYVGTQLIAALLRGGSRDSGGSGHSGQQPVRAQVRSAERADGLRAAIRRGTAGGAGPENTAGGAGPEHAADGAGLEVVTADLMSDDGWKAALAGVDEVYHVASPIPAAQPKDPDELVVPAREGTLRVLRAARDAGVRRVVLTSSFAAIGYTPKPEAEFTEDDWTDPDMPGLAPYPRSKTIAERTAWDFMNSEGGDTELTVVNPTFILGPPLTSETGSSLYLIKAMFDGTMSVAPRHRFGIVDVRDVADLHIRAMAAPAAAGKRFIGVSDHPAMSYLELAEILRERFGPLAAKAPTEEAPGDELPRQVIHNDRAKEELGWRPRPVETTIVDTVENLRARGDLPG
jgi:nucleoside-diphosphate-sugar epimerase